MKIIAIETIPVRVPIREHLAIRAKGGTHSVSPFLLVRIHTDEDGREAQAAMCRAFQQVLGTGNDVGREVERMVRGRLVSNPAVLVQTV